MTDQTLQVGLTAPAAARPGAPFSVNVDHTDLAARNITLTATASTPSGQTASTDTTVMVGEDVTVSLSSPDHGVAITESSPGVYTVTVQ